MISLVLPLAFAAWALAQGSKFLMARRHDPQAKFSDPGGMPSSHSATVAAGATVVGIEAGFDSALFGLAMIVLVIVVHDAYRLRWSVGEQAQRLNELLKQNDPRAVPVVVWKGHRQREVAAGLVLGAVVGSLAWVI
jgi:acid phosphatase family membrane protein YuiD